MVKQEQQISEVLRVLQENMQIPPGSLDEKYQIRSWRKKTFINQRISFKMAEIQTGDILYVIGAFL